jgi:hypothetical protein
MITLTIRTAWKLVTTIITLGLRSILLVNRVTEVQTVTVTQKELVTLVLVLPDWLLLLLEKPFWLLDL